MVPKVGLGSGSGSGLAAAVAVVFTVGSSTINRLLTELARAVLGNIGPRSWNIGHDRVCYYVALCLLCDTLFLIVKCTFGGLHLNMFVFFIHF